MLNQHFQLLLHIKSIQLEKLGLNFIVKEQQNTLNLSLWLAQTSIIIIIKT